MWCRCSRGNRGCSRTAMQHAFFVSYQGGRPPTGWPHTAQSGEPDCWGPEAKPLTLEPAPPTHTVGALEGAPSPHMRLQEKGCEQRMPHVLCMPSGRPGPSERPTSPDIGFQVIATQGKKRSVNATAKKATATLAATTPTYRQVHRCFSRCTRFLTKAFVPATNIGLLSSQNPRVASRAIPIQHDEHQT